MDVNNDQNISAIKNYLEEFIKKYNSLDELIDECKNHRVKGRPGKNASDSKLCEYVVRCQPSTVLYIICNNYQPSKFDLLIIHAISKFKCTWRTKYILEMYKTRKVNSNETMG